jgi:hypothetical protein
MVVELILERCHALLPLLVATLAMLVSFTSSETINYSGLAFCGDSFALLGEERKMLF